MKKIIKKYKTKYRKSDFPDTPSSGSSRGGAIIKTKTIYDQIAGKTDAPPTASGEMIARDKKSDSYIEEIEKGIGKDEKYYDQQKLIIGSVEASYQGVSASKREEKIKYFAERAFRQDMNYICTLLLKNTTVL